MTRRSGAPVVAILGGGFTGAAVAYHLSRVLPDEAPRIVVVEPRATLGAGLAYSTSEPSHRINVPAARMSIDSSDPEQFARWLEASGLPDDDPVAFDARGVFPQRGLFGRYVAAMLDPLVKANRIVHLRDHAGYVSRRRDGGFTVGLRNAPPMPADILVLATTHPLPDVPEPLRAVANAPGFLADPYRANALRDVPGGARVLVLGNGLTAADMIATLDRLGHRGTITALSRNGLRSRGHAPSQIEPFGDFTGSPSASALDLLGRVRRTIGEAATAGSSWHAVLDAVRNQGPAIWGALPERERRKLARRLRSFWDVHRFRIAPQVEAVLDRLAVDGRLRTIAASLRSAALSPDGIRIGFRRRHMREVETETFDVVVNTTEPAHRSVVEAQPASSLRDGGLIRLDTLGLGLATARDGRAIDMSGRSVPGLFIAGPLARGTFGELMGLLEVTRYAEFVAAQVAAELSRRSNALPCHRTTKSTGASAALAGRRD